MPERIGDKLENADEPADALRLAKMPRNDFGLGERLRARHGHEMAITPEAGWVAWDLRRWAVNHKGEAQAKMFAHKTAAAIAFHEYPVWKEAERERWKKEGRDPETKAFSDHCNKFWAFANKAGDSGRTAAMLSQAAPYLVAELKDFDPDPFRICCKNGTLELNFIDAPCLVAYDEAGAVTGFARVSDFKAGALAIGSTTIEQKPDRIWLVGDDPVDESDLKKGVWIGGEAVSTSPEQPGGGHSAEVRSDSAPGMTGRIKIVHRLYHLDVKLVPHNPAHRITRIANCDYDPAAKAPRWREHMETVLDDEGDRQWFQRAMGYGLTGATSSQCFLFLQGKGGDGKTTTLKAIRYAMGDYAAICDPRSWLESKQRSGADASPDMADMAGDTRLLTCEEPPKGARVNESMLKAASGGDPLKARQLHQSLFTFEPRFLVTMAFNDLPRITGGDDGFWRRMRLIRFRHQFTPEEIAKAGNIDHVLEGEASGILNWLLAGLAGWHKHGLAPTAPMAADILEYRSQSNPFGEWFRERVEAGAANDKVLNSELYGDYKEYLEAQQVSGNEVLGVKGFANQLSSLQIPLRKTNGGKRYRIGVKLKPKDEGFSPGDDDEGGNQ